MRGIHKKLTNEDKFARQYYYNSDRFVSKMKKGNRKKLRQLLKRNDVKEYDSNV